MAEETIDDGGLFESIAGGVSEVMAAELPEDDGLGGGLSLNLEEQADQFYDNVFDGDGASHLMWDGGEDAGSAQGGGKNNDRSMFW